MTKSKKTYKKSVLKNDDTKAADVTASLPRRDFDASAYIYLIFIALYLIVDIIPRGDIIDTAGQQRIQLDIINISAIIYILRKFSQGYGFKVSLFFKQIIPILFISFFVLSGISIFAGLNKVEGLLEYAAYTTTLISFLNIFTLIFLAKDNIKAISIIVTCIVLYQSGAELYKFLREVKTLPLWEAILNIKWTTGNKNIFGATLIVKLCFVVYTFLRSKGIFRYVALLTYFIALLTLFFISARAIYISSTLIILFIALGTTILYWKSEKRNSTLLHNAVLISLFVISFLIVDKTLTKYSKVGSDKQINTEQSQSSSFIEERAQTITDFDNSGTNIRLFMWKASLEGIKERPLLGYGLGNYKIESPRITGKYYTSNVFNRYNHNDFLQVAFESGIITGLLYFGLFVFAFIYTLKILFKKEYNQERKFAAILIFSGIIGYFIDSVFNFPLARPNMNIMFVLLLAMTIANYVSVKVKADTTSYNPVYKYIYYFILILGTGTFFINYINYKSYKAQYLIDTDSDKVDYSNPHPKYTYQQVEQMLSGSVPNLGVDSEPLLLKKAKYLYFEKRYQEMLDILKDYDKVSPYTVYDDNMKMLMYANLGKVDSAYKYSQVMFNERPYSYSDYKMNIELAGSNKDVNGVKKSFHDFNKYTQSQEAYEYYLKNLLKSEYDFKSDTTILAEGMRLYPESETVKSLKKYVDFLKSSNLTAEQLKLILNQNKK
ncbi:Lipid A core - O-antigen ligase and related enzymes [Sphingobacterium spiritivorum]|uniref:Lipid A core - O-antigen ligase and related enzymes n=1 Tax=Sphingobacterium spiritivorum TaxID=258 RepID=A0A380BA03_SPHSI|nr:O-antigen ligase family protein [Sphingobacterium spiritivorum]SUI97823.1 Lipid A core - O-antigen ligase and related enzymes [Sphingobacterium spiritivorum]